ncbi:hypothetical protein C5167_000373, partial [Papaver somniferum]
DYDNDYDIFLCIPTHYRSCSSYFMCAPVACLAVEPIGTSPSCFPKQGYITRQCKLKEFGRLPVKVL